MAKSQCRNKLKAEGNRLTDEPVMALNDSLLRACSAFDGGGIVDFTWLKWRY